MNNSSCGADCQEMTEYVTPAAMKVRHDVAVHPPASAFRNVSYQRATHDSMMGDSVVNQSPANNTATGQETATVNSVTETDRPTVENAEV